MPFTTAVMPEAVLRGPDPLSFFGNLDGLPCPRGHLAYEGVRRGPSPPNLGGVVVSSVLFGPEGPGDGEPKLSPDLEVVALLLAEGRSDADAGLKVGRSAKWVQRARSSSPEFVARVRELKEQRAAQVAAGLGALLEDAVAAVSRGLWAERPADQLRAASLVFDRFRVFRSETEAEERLAELQAEIVALREALDGLGAADAKEARS